MDNQDSNDFLTDTLGFGYDKRKVINDEILDEKTSFRDGFTKMLESIKTPFPECIEYLLKNIKLDPGFKECFNWAQTNDIPVIVVSSGMKPIIKALLQSLVGEESIDQIEIISNDVKVNDDGTWEIQYIDETPFGHDKSRAIRPYKESRKNEASQTLFYCGDGVSDLSAAKETDLLFAKRGKDLVTYCKRQGVVFRQFDSFKDILENIQLVVEGKKSVNELNENTQQIYIYLTN